MTLLSRGKFLRLGFWAIIGMAWLSDATSPDLFAARSCQYRHVEFALRT